MKVLVTGATGFIGRNLVKRLVDERKEVRCLVRKSSNIKQLKKQGVELCYGDLLNKNTFKQAVKNVDVVFHLASEVYPKKSPNYFKINVLGTSYLLRECRENKIKRFIYLSSTAVYGPLKNDNGILKEDSKRNPISYYGRTKVKAEDIVVHYYKNYAVPTVILRPSVVYGPGLYTFSLGSIFIYLIRNKSFLIIGNGNNLMSLCYIDNLIDAMFMAMNSEKAIGETFNISDDRNYSLKAISKIIASYYKAKTPSIHIPKILAKLFIPFLFVYTKLKKFEIQVSLNTIDEICGNWGVDINKAKNLLGYTPRVDLEKGIKKHLIPFKF